MNTNRFPSDPDQVIDIGITIPWRQNGRRALSTGLQPAYYACYLYQVTIHNNLDELRLYVQALGEWDLASPEQSLFCLLEPNESWDQLAAIERRNKSGSPSRFVRARWEPQQEANGYFRGYFVLSLDSLENVMQDGDKTARLVFRFGATSPWQTDFPVAEFLKLSRESVTCPRTRPPVPPTDPWGPVLPRNVLERFRQRELGREAEK